MKVSRVEEMRNLDKSAIEEFCITQELLMENAGEAAYFVVLKEFGVKDKKFVLFCGIGNNGGDGLVAARKIHSTGGKVLVYILGDKRKYKGSTVLTPHLGEMSRIVNLSIAYTLCRNNDESMDSGKTG